MFLRIISYVGTERRHLELILPDLYESIIKSWKYLADLDRIKWQLYELPYSQNIGYTY